VFSTQSVGAVAPPPPPPPRPPPPRPCLASFPSCRRLFPSHYHKQLKETELDGRCESIAPALLSARTHMHARGPYSTANRYILLRSRWCISMAACSLFPQRGTCPGTAERVGQDQSTFTFGRCVSKAVRWCRFPGRCGTSLLCCALVGARVQPIPSANHSRPCGPEDERSLTFASQDYRSGVQRRKCRRHRRWMAT
jgi:hypothetical protein